MKDVLDFYTNGSLLELGAEADRVRRALHPHNTVTYIVDRNINYTNVCVADCGFCAFYRRPKHGEGWTLSFEEIGRKIHEAKELGAVQILMQGGHNPYIPFEWYLDLLKYIKTYHPIHIHGFSPSEVDFFAKTFRMDARDVIRELKAAGLNSIPGGGGEILVQRVRDLVARKKAGADRWLEIMELAHNEGMKTSVTMMYGIGETLAERLEHLQRVREIQSRTGGFTAFICWPLQPENTPTMSQQPKTDAVDYLRTVAIARIALDNVPNLQASWVTMGMKIGQVALRFGCNDFGSLMIEENVVSAANTTHRTTTDVERLGHAALDTTRLLVGLLQPRDGAASRTVAALDVDPGGLLATAAQRLRAGRLGADSEGRLSQPLEVAGATEQILERAAAVARERSADAVSDVDILVACAERSDTVAGGILRQAGVTPGRLRAASQMPPAGTQPAS